MKISELQNLLEKVKEEYGDVEVVIHKYHYADVTEVVPIFKQEALSITEMVVSKVEIY